MSLSQKSEQIMLLQGDTKYKILYNLVRVGFVKKAVRHHKGAPPFSRVNVTPMDALNSIEKDSDNKTSCLAALRCRIYSSDRHCNVREQDPLFHKVHPS